MSKVAAGESSARPRMPRRESGGDAHAEEMEPRKYSASRAKVVFNELRVERTTLGKVSGKPLNGIAKLRNSAQGEFNQI
jgi:hypothetical protein